MTAKYKHKDIGKIGQFTHLHSFPLKTAAKHSLWPHYPTKQLQPTCSVAVKLYGELIHMEPYSVTLHGTRVLTYHGTIPVPTSLRTTSINHLRNSACGHRVRPEIRSIVPESPLGLLSVFPRIFWIRRT